MSSWTVDSVFFHFSLDIPNLTRVILPNTFQNVMCSTMRKTIIED